MVGCLDALLLLFACNVFPVVSSSYLLGPLPRDLPQCELASYLRTRRLRASWRAKLEIRGGVRGTRVSPLFSTRTANSRCVDLLCYKFGRSNNAREPHAYGWDKPSGSSICTGGVPVLAALICVVHRRLLLSFQPAHIGRHSSLYPQRSKPPMSLPLAGKFLQVAPTTKTVAMSPLITICEIAPSLFHNVGSVLASSDV